MSATDRPLALRLAADLRRREFLARACNSAASAANPSDWRGLAAAELERLSAVELERDAYRLELTAVMPADFKDWHKGSAAEWPELAAMAVINLRAERDDLAAEVEQLRAAPAPAVETVCARCGGIVSDPLLPGECAATAADAQPMDWYLVPSLVPWISELTQPEDRSQATIGVGTVAQPLTIEQINRIEMSTEWPESSLRNIGPRDWGRLLVAVTRAVEHAHGIGQEGGAV